MSCQRRRERGRGAERESKRAMDMSSRREREGERGRAGVKESEGPIPMRCRKWRGRREGGAWGRRVPIAPLSLFQLTLLLALLPLLTSMAHGAPKTKAIPAPRKSVPPPIFHARFNIESVVLNPDCKFARRTVVGETEGAAYRAQNCSISKVN